MEVGEWLKDNLPVLIWLAFVAFVGLLILTFGWTSFWNGLSGLWGSENIDAIGEICQTACVEENAHAYCDVTRSVRFSEPTRVTYLQHGLLEDSFEPKTGLTEKVYATCAQMSSGKISAKGNDGNVRDFSVSFPGVKLAHCQQLCQ